MLSRRLSIRLQDSSLTVLTSLKSDRVMTGEAVGGYFADGTSYETTLPQLTATAYLKGVALDPQPSFKWYSSNPDVIAVDQVRREMSRPVDEARIRALQEGRTYDDQGNRL